MEIILWRPNIETLNYLYIFINPIYVYIFINPMKKLTKKLLIKMSNEKSLAASARANTD